MGVLFHSNGPLTLSTLDDEKHGGQGSVATQIPAS